MKKSIYMDHNATTPIDPRVLDEMMPYFKDKFGNASSTDHVFGNEALMAVETSRMLIADMIGAHPNEIIFTSGATESNNIAILGTMEKYDRKGDHIITCVTEHPAVLNTVKHIENIGKKVTYLPVDKYGNIDINELKKSISNNTIMISIMAANNEIGTIADVEKIGTIAHEHNIIFHTDAAQAIGHIPINVKKLNIDLMSFSSHKIYGPKGIGALYIRSMKPRVTLNSIMYGGGQERNIRSGTLNVPSIVGFGKAVTLAKKEFAEENIRYTKWFNKLTTEFQKIGGILNGPPKNRLLHNINVYFPRIESKAIINSISNHLAISASSACTTQQVEPSHVLLAIGLDKDKAHSSIRIGLGRFNTDADVDVACKLICKTVNDLSKIVDNGTIR